MTLLIVVTISFFSACWVLHGAFFHVTHHWSQVTFAVFVLVIPVLYLSVMAFLCHLVARPNPPTAVHQQALKGGLEPQ